MSAADLSPLTSKTKTPAAFANGRVWRHFWIDSPLGFAVLVVSILAGEQVKTWLHLPIPGNVLGLFNSFTLLSPAADPAATY